jgi:hypothetical protein
MEQWLREAVSEQQTEKHIQEASSCYAEIQPWIEDLLQMATSYHIWEAVLEQ